MNKKILVVDDDRVMLKFITKLLVREGHEVQTAEDGFAALNLRCSYPVELQIIQRNKQGNPTNVTIKRNPPTIEPGQKVLFLLRDYFDFNPDVRYTLRTKNADANFQLMGLQISSSYMFPKPITPAAFRD